MNMGMWMAQGKLKSKEDVYVGIENFHDTFKRLFTGEKKGKLVLKVLEELQNDVSEDSGDAEVFRKLMKDILSVTGMFNGLLEKAIKADEHWLLSNFTRLIKK